MHEVRLGLYRFLVQNPDTPILIRGMYLRYYKTTAFLGVREISEKGLTARTFADLMHAGLNGLKQPRWSLRVMPNYGTFTPGDLTYLGKDYYEDLTKQYRVQTTPSHHKTVMTKGVPLFTTDGGSLYESGDRGTAVPTSKSRFTPFRMCLTAVLQALELFLHYAKAGFFGKDHWVVYLLPTFVALIFLVVVMASAALFESRRKPSTGDSSQAVLSHVLFQMLTTVGALFTWLLLILYLDEDTDLPFYWITTSLFVTSFLVFVTLIAYYMRLGEDQPEGCPPLRRSTTHIYVGFLALWQGLFYWLYVSPWGRLMKVPVAVVAIPAILFLVTSFVFTLKQTYMHRNDKGVQKIKQIAFMFLILVTMYTFMALLVHFSDEDVGWSKPMWAILPFMIYSAILVPVSIYVYYQESKERDDQQDECTELSSFVAPQNYAPSTFSTTNVYAPPQEYNYAYNTRNDALYAATGAIEETYNMHV